MTSCTREEIFNVIKNIICEIGPIPNVETLADELELQYVISVEDNQRVKSKKFPLEQNLYLFRVLLPSKISSSKPATILDPLIKSLGKLQLYEHVKYLFTHTTGTRLPIHKYFPKNQTGGYDIKTILVIGNTRTGKSAFCNQLSTRLSHNNGQQCCFFKESDNGEPQTDEIVVKLSDFDTNQGFFLIDCPGFQDSDVADQKLSRQILQYIKAQEKIHAVCIMCKYDDGDLDQVFELSSSKLSPIFSMSKFSENTALIVTGAPCAAIDLKIVEKYWEIAQEHVSGHKKVVRTGHAVHQSVRDAWILDYFPNISKYIIFINPPSSLFGEAEGL